MAAGTATRAVADSRTAVFFIGLFLSWGFRCTSFGAASRPDGKLRQKPLQECSHRWARLARVTTWFESPDDAAARLREAGYLADAPRRSRRTSRARWRSRCSSRARPASARPSSPRRSPGRRARSWCGCSATRDSTRRGRSTSGTTRSSCSASRPAGGDQAWSETHDDIFTEEFLLTRPLLTAIRRDEPTVLLIDEVDKTDVEVEGLLLEVLSDFQVTIPELGTVARRPPPVRRADLQRQPRAVRGGQAPLPLPAPRLPRRRARARDRHLPGARPRRPGRRASSSTSSCRLRELELKKAPSIAESVDWARTLIALQIGDLDEAAVARTLGVVLKHASDQRRARSRSSKLADERP